MPEYHSGKKHDSGFSGEIHIGNYTSERMRLLREKRRGDKPELSEEEELQKLRDEFGKRIALSEQQKDAATSVEHHQRLEKKQSKSQYTPILLEEAPVPSPEQSITASVAIAKQAYQQQDYANAYELFTQIVNKQPDNYEALFHLGVSATETGNHTVAIETTKKLIDSGHFTAQAFYFQGRSLEELGRKPEAAIAYQKAAFEIPEAHQAFMRLKEEKLLGGFSSKIASAEDRGVTKQKNQGRRSQPTKSASTSPQSSKPSKSSRSVREDTTFNQSGRPSNYQREDTTYSQPRKQNKPSDSRRKDTTFNQSGNSRSSFNFRGKDIAPTILVKQGKTATKAKGQLDVSKLVPVEKLAEAVSRSAKALPEEVAEELRALFTPATLATMVGVFAAYIAAHATGIGQAMDIGMLIAGGIFFGLDAFTIFKDIAGFAGAVNATTEEELDRAGEHLASAVASIGVDAVMTLLTKKVADEIGKTVDHVDRVDEVHAHSEGANRNAGNLDNADNANVGRGNDVDRANTNPSNLDNTDGVFDKVPAQPRLEPEGANTSPSQTDKTNQPIQTQRNNIDGVPSHTSNRLGNPSPQEIKRIQRDYKPDSESEARAVWHILQQNSTEQVIAGENDIKRFFDISTKEKKVNMVDALKIEKSGMLIPVEVKNMKTIDLYEGQNAAFKKFEAISRRVNMSQIDHFEVMCHPNSRLPPNVRVDRQGKVSQMISGIQPPQWKIVTFGGKPVYIKYGNLGEISR